MNNGKKTSQQRTDLVIKQPTIRAVACLLKNQGTNNQRNTINTTERDYRVLQALECNPSASQRELAKQLGVSLGKVNYCLKALIDKGWVKAGNFKRSDNKSSYLYLLTPKGIEQKSKLTKAYLARKITEYEQLKKEIEQLQNQVG